MSPDTKSTFNLTNSTLDYCQVNTNKTNFLFQKNLFLSTGKLSSYTNSPLYFQINGINKMTLNSNGNLGIGTAASTANLQVGELTMNSLVNLGGYAFLGSLKSSGDLFLGKNVYAKYNSTTENGIIRTSIGCPQGFAAMQFENYGVIKFYLKTTSVQADEQVNVAARNIMTIHGNGYVGINGNLWAKEIQVALVNPWADYVFENKYTLMPINELKTYISKNKHLPNIPSASEIEKSGINVNEMLTLQMEKIEELTLYIIQLQEQINEMKNYK